MNKPVLITAPTAEPISPSEIKDFLGIDHDTQDLLLLRLCSAARQRLESYLGRQLLPATYQYNLDRFPCGEIRLPVLPITAVSSIVYVDTNGDEQTWDSEDYEVDIYSGRIKPISSAAYPQIANQYNAITITFTAGVSSTALPEKYKIALLFAIQALYEASAFGEVQEQKDLYDLYELLIGEERNYRYI